MHPANPFRNGYDFAKLVAENPALGAFVHRAKSGRETIDFSDSQAVKTLNQSLLKTQYGLLHWDIPNDYLCPPVPGRLDYLLHVADLLAIDSRERERIRLLDLGCGANCIFPILARLALRWDCVGTEVDARAFKVARAIVGANKSLRAGVEIRRQPDPAALFSEVVEAGESFHACVCNPPFYGSAAEAQRNYRSKWRKLGRPQQTRNFGGRNHELVTAGGEKAFALRLVRESSERPRLCRWFTIMLAKQKHETPVYQALKRAKARRIEVIPLAQGNKQIRIIAWRFY